jgi:hypothetical protein
MLEKRPRGSNWNPWNPWICRPASFNGPIYGLTRYWLTVWLAQSYRRKDDERKPPFGHKVLVNSPRALVACAHSKLNGGGGTAHARTRGSLAASRALRARKNCSLGAEKWQMLRFPLQPASIRALLKTSSTASDIPPEAAHAHSQRENVAGPALG